MSPLSFGGKENFFKKIFQIGETKPLLVRIRWCKIITQRIMEDKKCLWKK